MASDLSHRQVTASAVVGTALEYYDFFLYAAAAALIFPSVFFPKNHQTLGVLVSMAAFGSAYVMRLVGALFFGRIGDRLGRKKVLSYSMILMGLSTLFIAFIPPFEKIGIAAPILLLVLRLLQGFAIAGEISGSGTLVFETVPPQKRNFFSSFITSGGHGGHLLAAAIFIPLYHFLPTQSMLAWGWRIPFVLSVLVLILGLWVRKNLPESPRFIQMQTEDSVVASPIAILFSHHKADLLRVCIIVMGSVISFAVPVYGMTLGVQHVYGFNLSPNIFLVMVTLCGLCSLVTLPLWGILADKTSGRFVLLICTLGCIPLIWLYFYSIASGHVDYIIGSAIVCWSIVYGGIDSVFIAFYARQFPPQVRASGVSIGLAVGLILSSAFPMLASMIAPPTDPHLLFKVSLLASVYLLLSVAALCVRSDPDAALVA